MYIIIIIIIMHMHYMLWELTRFSTSRVWTGLDCEILYCLY